MAPYRLALLLVLGLILSYAGNVWSGEEEAAFNPFFAFKNSMEFGGPKAVADQAQILKKLGFDGFDNRDLNDLEASLKALEQRDLKLYTIYFTVRIDPGETPYNPRLKELLPLLKGRETILWCNTHSKVFAPSDSAGDARAVPLFREIAELAAPYGVRVAPYPHINLWCESPEDTIRLAEKVDRSNFGASFNLFHWNALGKKRTPLKELLPRLVPRMLVMSINGDKGPHKIGPLEEASLDEYETLINAFREAGYRGPVGLQCYRIPGDPRMHLGQSMRVWRKLEQRFSR